MNETWTTDDEIDYVKNLGRKQGQNARELLAKYIAANKFRNWGRLDGKRILAAAEQRLRNLQMQQRRK